MRSRIRAVGLAMITLLGLVLAVQVYWQVIAAPALKALPYDTHRELHAKLARPGRLITRDGTTILLPIRSDGGWTYRYQAPSEFAHLTGYNAHTGLRAKLFPTLSGEKSYGGWRARLMAPVPPGCDVVLTVDSRAQHAADEALLGYKGCAIAVRAADGAVLAAASTPTYNPVSMGSPQEVELVETNPNKPLLFRVTQKLYNPGWAMAWVAAAAVLNQGGDEAKATYDCTGSWQCGRMRVECTRIHGRVTLPQAVMEDCRVGVTKAADRLGPDRFRAFVKALHLLDRAGDMPIASVQGRLPDLFNWRGRENLADTVLGDRFVELTPLAVERFFLAVARGGQVIQPYLVSQVRSPTGRELRSGKAKVLGQAFSQPVASQLVDMLHLDAARYAERYPDEVRRRQDWQSIGMAGWWVPKSRNATTGTGWFVGIVGSGQPQVVLTFVLEDVPDDRMAVELGVSLLHYLEQMSV